MSKGKINVYTCSNNHKTVTIDVDNGTTPMFLRCETCGLMGASAMYMCDQDLTPTHEWYRMKDELEVAVESKNFSVHNKLHWDNVRLGFLDHHRKGGLFIRKIKKQ